MNGDIGDGSDPLFDDLVPPGEPPSLELLAVLRNPTLCYVDGCDAENEVVIHFSDSPGRYADLCLPHARSHLASSLVIQCECPVCGLARLRLGLAN